MASKILIDTALQLYKSLGGNVGKVLGTRTNVNFLGKGKSPELMVDMDINPEALGVLSKSKAVEELDSAMGYLTSNKLTDIQANQLIKNMNTMKTVYDPPAPPANITDMVTGTRGLNKEGLESLRSMADDLPPPGSRGGADDIAGPTLSDANAPFTGKGLEAIKSVKNNNLIMNDVVNKIYLNAGVSANAQPAARANAREFLNRIKDLEDPTNKSGPTLSSIMEVDDFKFMTEGGGGGMGDPMLLVQKYFGPKVASSVAQLDNADDIQKFAENLIKIKDAKGNSVTSRFFDPESISPDDFKFEDGGRVGYFGGARVLGKMGYQALRKYGIEAEDITKLFANLGADKTLRGKEKTMYFQQLHKVLRNPDQYPEGVMDIQKQLGLDIGIGFRNGGLAGILEV
tara:strand:- start:1715 stop:2914 length:1200 start_codon:yes stop_codon:yes gene_type:complete